MAATPNAARALVRSRAVAIILPLIAGVSPGSLMSQASERYVEGEAIVTFRSAPPPALARASASRHGSELAKHFGWLSARRNRGCALFRSSSKTTAALIAELRQDPDVETAEPNYLRWPCDSPPPNDPFFPQLWGLQNTGQTVNGTPGTAGVDIGYLEAWPLRRETANPPIVAVIDTGIDYTHPDLVGNLWTNPGETPGNANDDDGNGYADDVHGYDFTAGTANPTDSGDHGTHTAGTIAAVGDNGTGLIGANSRSRIMALKVSSDGTYFTTDAVIEAVQYAAMMRSRGANVVAINASFGGGGSSDAEKSAIQAAGNAGIVFCAAAGNESANNNSTKFYPASYRLPNMVVVAATDQKDSLASFSNYGSTTVDLAAPGVNIFSAMPTWLPATTASVRRGSTTYSAIGLTYAGLTAGTTGMIYSCGLGYPADFPGGVSNNIALIQRGTLTFSNKVGNAMAAGAKAAIIYNNVTGSIIPTLQAPDSWVPAVFLSKADGESLRSALPATGTVVNSVSPSSFYQYQDGTSMATPHVSAAVAFAAENFPSESVAQRIQRILTNVTHVAALGGKVITGGRLNLARSVDADANALPDWWELQYFGRPTGADPSADPDADRTSTRDEFYAGTDPSRSASYPRVTDVARLADGSGSRITWPCSPGRTYQIQYADSPAGPWLNDLPNSTMIAPPGSISLSYIDATSPPPARRFYRILLTIP